jgi:hypothetical protein
LPRDPVSAYVTTRQINEGAFPVAKWDAFELNDDEQRETLVDYEDIGYARKPARIPLAIAFVAALAGIYFAATSTADFVAHLDRQVHAMHCSVVPGSNATLGESGCRAVMLSPYSSWFRDQYWGGIPISLLAMAVFAFLAYRIGHLVWRGRPARIESGLILLASFLPVVMSVVYGQLAMSKVGEMCNVCIGIYWSSGVLFASMLLAVFMSDTAAVTVKGGSARRFGVGLVEGLCFVGVAGLVYVTAIPVVTAGNAAIKGSAGCGILTQPEDKNRIMIDLSVNSGGTPSIEILDPLCPACRAFDERLEASGLHKKLSQKAVLFPLDSKCNWMVKTSLHPGACAVSEAMLCAPVDAKRILKWAFEKQPELLKLGEDEKQLRRLLQSTFPAVEGCLGTAVARNKVVRSLRWVVSNALPVMTPQLFVDGKRLCDEDTDLGLEYTLTRLLGGGR